MSNEGTIKVGDKYLYCSSQALREAPIEMHVTRVNNSIISLEGRTKNSGCVLVNLKRSSLNPRFGYYTPEEYAEYIRRINSSIIPL